MVLEDYERQILTLLPRGAAWAGENLRKIVSALAGECYRVATGGEHLATEANPATCDDLLPDFERLVGLPYPGFELAGTDAERRSDVLAILLAQGGQSKNYFLELIAGRGHVDAYIVDGFASFVAGSTAGGRLYGEEWPFFWEVHFAPSSSSDPLLEFLITRFAPAHTLVRFVYDS